MIALFFRPVHTIARSTFREIIRDRVLYNIILCAVLLLGVAFLASQLTFVGPDRIVLDFGISVLNLSCTFLGILIGGSLLSKEFERRTIFVVLSRPVSRSQFLVGKYLGLISVLTLNWFLFSLLYVGIYSMVGGEVSSTLVFANFLILVQSSAVAAIVVLLSTFSTPAISIVISIGLYLIGNNISQLRLLSSKLDLDLFKGILDVLIGLLPNFEHFNLGTQLTYHLDIGWRFLGTSFAYGLFLITLSLAFGSISLRMKESGE